MSVLAVDIGIAARLTGQLPGTVRPGVGGFQAPIVDAQTGQVSAVSVGALAPRTQGIRGEIPVFRFRGAGALGPDKWPSIGYALVTMRDDPDRYVPKDPIWNNVPGAETTVTLSDGTVKNGYQLKTKREHPDPVIVTVDLVVMAGDPTVAQLLLGEVCRVFPRHGSLPIRWADGSAYSLQMDRRGMVQLADGGPSEEMPDEEAGYRWVVSYDVETWFDNTLDTELVRTITNPQYTMHKL